MSPKRRPMRPHAAWTLALIAGLAIAFSAACAPGSGLPSQPQGTTGGATGSSEATGSTPSASQSTGGSVIPEIKF